MLNLITTTLVLMGILTSFAFAQEPAHDPKDKHQPLRQHSAMVLDSDQTIKIPCTNAMMRLLIITARDAGNHAGWSELEEKTKPEKCVTAKTNAFSPYKAHLGSRGFTGLRSITVEIEKPYRVIIEDARETCISQLSDDSDILHAIVALWQTSISLQETPR